MSNSALFISDLHLDPGQPAVLQAFVDLLRGRARAVDTLFVLGDLFEAWVGDDDTSEPAATATRELRALADSGTHIQVMHGNRDFLLGSTFAAAAGVELLPDPSVVAVAGQRLLLLHGDSLCTADTDYQAVRVLLRSSAWQDEILAKPLAERRAMAAGMRAQSAQANANKADNIMDVTPDEVVAAMARHQVQTMVHGHTHRPAVHQHQVDGQPALRWVLGDWAAEGWYLVMDANGMQLERFAITPG